MTTPRLQLSASKLDSSQARPAPPHGTEATLLLDRKAVCVCLSIGQRRLWELTNCNAIPSRRIGRSVRYEPSELRAWVAMGCPTEPGAGRRVRAEVEECNR